MTVEPAMPSAPAVYVSVPEILTVPEMVIVPAVLMVRLFAIDPLPAAQDQVPVPLRTRFVVPARKEFPPVKLPPIYIVNPLSVQVKEQFTNRVPLRLRFDNSVPVLVPVNVTLFQLMPLVFSVVEAMIFNVEPVVTTVPAV